MPPDLPRPHRYPPPFQHSPHSTIPKLEIVYESQPLQTFAPVPPLLRPNVADRIFRWVSHFKAFFDKFFPRGCPPRPVDHYATHGEGIPFPPPPHHHDQLTPQHEKSSHLHHQENSSRFAVEFGAGSDIGAVEVDISPYREHQHSSPPSSRHEADHLHYSVDPLRLKQLQIDLERIWEVNRKAKTSPTHLANQLAEFQLYFEMSPELTPLMREKFVPLVGEDQWLIIQDRMQRLLELHAYEKYLDLKRSSRNLPSNHLYFLQKAIEDLDNPTHQYEVHDTTRQILEQNETLRKRVDQAREDFDSFLHLKGLSLREISTPELLKQVQLFEPTVEQYPIYKGRRSIFIRSLLLVLRRSRPVDTSLGTGMNQLAAQYSGQR